MSWKIIHKKLPRKFKEQIVAFLGFCLLSIPTTLLVESYVNWTHIHGWILWMLCFYVVVSFFAKITVLQEGYAEYLKVSSVFLIFYLSLS